MNAIFCALALACAFMGMLIRIGKGDALMVGFVKDFKKKKDSYALDRLRAYVARIQYLCAGCFFIMAMGVVLEMKMVTWIGIVIFFGIIVYSSRYTSEVDNFKKEGAE